ncbi:50S ribosomal protein 5 [Dioscorea alata]|uniref:50S ribosomal protein 5 n=1 Tax=Dioscorea alata TaxID=55571 RepID=A0ACB7TVS7_DIOAL|nr:50S ribosomal protein 5 [Dioscorea alata]
MALLLPHLSLLSSSLIPPSSSSLQPTSIPIASRPFARLWQQDLVLQRGTLRGVRVGKTLGFHNRSITVRASSQVDGADDGGPDSIPSQRPEEAVAVENLPLESKQQMILEQRLRMKLAKKIRLRRKRLLRKRRMRKKGRWPPSKMKKNKNV